MRYIFLSAHCVQGIAHPAGEPDITLFDDAAMAIRVLLTANAAQHLRLLNRHLALLSMIMRAMIGDPLPDDFAASLDAETTKVEHQRQDSIGTDAVVIVEISGDIDAQIPAAARHIQDFVLCIDAFDKKALKARLHSQISAVLSALRTGTG